MTITAKSSITTITDFDDLNYIIQEFDAFNLLFTRSPLIRVQMASDTFYL